MLYNNGMHRRQQAFSMGENAVMVLGESPGHNNCLPCLAAWLPACGEVLSGRVRAEI